MSCSHRRPRVLIALLFAATLLPSPGAVAQATPARPLILALPEPAAFAALAPSAAHVGSAPILAVVISFGRSDMIVLNPAVAGPTGLRVAVVALRTLRARGQIEPGAHLVLPAPPGISASTAAGSADARYAATLDRLRARPLGGIEGVGHGRWLRFADATDLSGGT